MTTITAPLTHAILAAKAVLPHMAKDNATPVLSTARLTLTLATPSTPATLTLTATDRYTVGQYSITTESHEDKSPVSAAAAVDPDAVDPDATTTDTTATTDVLLPREAVEWLAKIDQGKLRRGQKNNPQPHNAHVLQVSSESQGDGSTGNAVRLSILSAATGFDSTKPEKSEAFDSFVTSGFPSADRLFPADGESFPIPAGVYMDPKKLARVLTFAAQNADGEAVRFHGGADPATSNKVPPVMLTVGNLRALIQPTNVLR